MSTYPDGVWESDYGAGPMSDDEARADWAALRDAPGWQRVVTGPSGHVWTWKPFPRFPMDNARFVPYPEPAGSTGEAD